MQLRHTLSSQTVGIRVLIFWGKKTMPFYNQFNIKKRKIQNLQLRHFTSEQQYSQVVINWI